MSKLKITSFGGLGHTGALNCMLYETDKTAILVDCGVGFVDDRYPGADLMIPDFTLLEEKRDKLRAILLTHGHEDHVGALPYLLKRFPLPVYATPFTRGIIQSKFEEFKLKKTIVHDLSPDQKIQIDDIHIEPVFINHSIMDVVALYLQTDSLKAFHCTDFKIDDKNPKERAIDLARFKSIGQEQLDLLLLDSTNALEKGATESEAAIKDSLLETFQKVKGRLITCLFSSNTYRLQTLLECARQTGRKVALTGRSTKEYFRIAAALDRLDLAGIEFYDVEEITDFEDHQILVIVTGSQAEPRSVLGRMSQNMFKPFKIRKGDTLLMSSRMIPGNEGRILMMLNNLAQLGAHIITDNEYQPVHVSGHAMADELKEVLQLLQPKHLIPIHGEFRHLQELACIAQTEGVLAENIHILHNGLVAQLSQTGVDIVDEIPMEPVFVSENPNHFISNEAIRRRKKMAFNGLIVVSVLYHKEEQRVVLPFRLYSDGVFGGSVEVDIVRELNEVLEKASLAEKDLKVDILYKFYKSAVRRFFRTNYKIQPEVVVMVNEI